MAKFYGKLGYVSEIETRPSVYTPEIVERQYSGELIKNYRRLEKGTGANDDVDISNDISIVVDPYAMSHFHELRYVRWRGGYWKVTSVSVEFPRLTLSIGGVYNGPTAAA